MLILGEQDSAQHGGFVAATHGHGNVPMVTNISESRLWACKAFHSKPSPGVRLVDAAHILSSLTLQIRHWEVSWS